MKVIIIVLLLMFGVLNKFHTPYVGMTSFTVFATSLLSFCLRNVSKSSGTTLPLILAIVSIIFAAFLYLPVAINHRGDSGNMKKQLNNNSSGSETARDRYLQSRTKKTIPASITKPME